MESVDNTILLSSSEKENIFITNFISIEMSLILERSAIFLGIVPVHFERVVSYIAYL